MLHWHEGHLPLNLTRGLLLRLVVNRALPSEKRLFLLLEGRRQDVVSAADHLLMLLVDLTKQVLLN